MGLGWEMITGRVLRNLGITPELKLDTERCHQSHFILISFLVEAQVDHTSEYINNLLSKNIRCAKSLVKVWVASP